MSVDIIYRRFGLFPIKVVWFNRDSKYFPSSRYVTHTLRQSEPLIDYNKNICLNESVFTTLIINLNQPKEQIYKAMAPKSCRYEIRKIQKIVDNGESVQIKHNFDLEVFVRMANEYIKEKRYSKPLRLSHLRTYIKDKSGDLFSIYYQNRLIGGNFYILDYPDRVRLLYSFNTRLQDKELQKLSGAFMRYLHWQVMGNYKEQGFRWYDMGGLNLDKDSSAYGITKFKLSFGGTIRKEHDYVFVPKYWVSKLMRFYRFITTRGLRHD